MAAEAKYREGMAALERGNKACVRLALFLVCMCAGERG
jgi:hypothetical protein